mmetsp:Transcript_2816/g.3326  ORF Transcript_2816/g.3326 Transcript_2816/m.3326 type:complete len:412 (+) Transcript_2816:127-1362(+)|eukprot:CAMPEP_0194153962 /NCGR_PEP_ID=MMETSP0152-20130528/58633_1 /TAXON_ID=1049557 /ORGANISM="Thalassiothrix antarctica, Strain L6-D1" /LENGTH=411 /DNA_ID=CAMNT_0038859683 /DNA_START=82 /DNA_END=1317 /DNA_ORIENTATION=+
MESPPMVDHSQGAGGVATMPPQHLQTLISAPQGPRALPSVFAYHPGGINRHAVVRSNFPASFVRSTRSSVFATSDGRTHDSKEDERKPSPRNIRSTPQSFNSNDIDPVRAALSLDSNFSRSTTQTISAVPSAPLTRAARKRRNAVTSPPVSKRRAIVSRDEKPAALKSDPDETGSCCICMCDPDPGEISTVDGCEHNFCFDCIEKWSERENTCPLCKSRFKRITRVHKGKKIKGKKGSKKVKQRDQRADLNPNSNLESLLANLHAGAARFENPLTQLIVSSLNTQSSQLGLGMQRGGDRLRYRNPSSHFDEVLFSDNDEGSDVEGNGFTFVENIRRINNRRSGELLNYPTFLTPLRPVFPTTIPAAVPPRSYATNAHDINAGGTADNALEIVDDSEDDDEVEVVDVIGRAV